MSEFKRMNLGGAPATDCSQATVTQKYYEYTDKKALTDVLLATSVKDIEAELSTYTKAQLTTTFRTVYETNPLTSYDKARIVKLIVMYRLDMHRTEVLLGDKRQP